MRFSDSFPILGFETADAQRWLGITGLKGKTAIRFAATAYQKTRSLTWTESPTKNQRNLFQQSEPPLRIFAAAGRNLDHAFVCYIGDEEIACCVDRDPVGARQPLSIDCRRDGNWSAAAVR
jgi:hypothetical protein